MSEKDSSCCPHFFIVPCFPISLRRSKLRYTRPANRWSRGCSSIRSPHQRLPHIALKSQRSCTKPRQRRRDRYRQSGNELSVNIPDHIRKQKADGKKPEITVPNRPPNRSYKNTTASVIFQYALYFLSWFFLYGQNNSFVRESNQNLSFIYPPAARCQGLLQTFSNPPVLFLQTSHEDLCSPGPLPA